MPSDNLGAIGVGVSRGARAFRDYRSLQYREMDLERQNRLAKMRADEEATTKLDDENAAKKLAEIRTKLNNIRSQAGIYETDELGNTVIREDIFNERIAPLLEEAASVKSKNQDGADWADFYFKVNIAHRLPVQRKPASQSSMSDLDAHVQAALDAEAFQAGHDLSPIEKEAVRKRATKEFTELTDKTDARTPKTLEERMMEYAEKIYQAKSLQKGYTPENALAEAQQFYGAAKSFLENPDVPIVPPATGQGKKVKQAGPSEPGFFENLLKGLWKGKGEPQPTAAPAAEPDTVEQDIDSLAKEPAPQDLGDVPGGIDINAKAEDESPTETSPGFNYFEDLQDYLKNKLAADKDSAYYQKVLSAGGRALPKRGKK